MWYLPLSPPGALPLAKAVGNRPTELSVDIRGSPGAVQTGTGYQAGPETGLCLTKSQQFANNIENRPPGDLDEFT